MKKHRFNKDSVCRNCKCSSFVISSFDVECPPSLLAEMEKDRWCSSCFKRTNHRRLRHDWIGRNDYACQNCGNHTVKCIAFGCTHMALGTIPPKDDGWLTQISSRVCEAYCAVHKGQIASFERLHERIPDISEYLHLAERDSFNYSKGTKVVTAALAAAAMITPAAVASAPALASALGSLGVLGAAGTGTAIGSLSGAALTSASLAALGSTVAGGTMVVTAAGAAIGAWQGGLIANTYAREVADFRVRRINEGSGKGPAVICLDGFLTQGIKGVEKEWVDGLARSFPDSPWYHILWESKALGDLGAMAALGLHKNGMPHLANLATKAMKKPSMGLGSVLMGLQLAGNPWHVAMVKSMMTGALIADMLCRTTQKRKFILVGHSLGARVIFYALENLATRKGAPKVAHAILLGGAVGREPQHWETAAKAVSGKIVNCYSQRDNVLKYLYKTGTAFTSDPVGRGPIDSKSDKIANVDATRLVAGHTAYKPILSQVMAEVLPLLG